MKNKNKIKKFIYILCGLGLLLWVLFRVSVLVAQNRQQVFNVSRDVAESGRPVWVMHVKNESDILREPITIKDNRALVSGGRVGLFRAGEKIGNGEIVSVSAKIDIDTGMYVIKTKNVQDGLQYAEYRRNGYFVPSYSVNNGKVFILQNGLAIARDVVVARQDADNALITQGLDDGDIVILSDVQDGEKVQEQFQK
ncbi:MAG: hypothetical protein ACLRFI_03485 [Alphaproteobacteria bacterium]